MKAILTFQNVGLETSKKDGWENKQASKQESNVYKLSWTLF